MYMYLKCLLGVSDFSLKQLHNCNLHLLIYWKLFFQVARLNTYLIIPVCDWWIQVPQFSHGL